MTAEWFLWYGMRLGLTRDEALAIPFSLLQDLIAVEQIKVEGFERKRTQAGEYRELMRVLAFS